MERNLDPAVPVVLITGATSGIGLATAHALAEMDYRLLMHGRNEARTRAAVSEVSERSGNYDVEYILGDFDSLDSVRILAELVRRRTLRLDVLINNAGTIRTEYRETSDGFEEQVAINHLAPFLLTNLLLDMLKASAPSRVVTVASGAHRRFPIDFDDLFCKQDYETWKAYGRSKLMNILFTTELARRLEGTGVTANSLSPGLVHTEFGVKDGMGQEQQELMNRGATPEDGARTSVYLATSPEVDGVTGGYFSNCAPAEVSQGGLDPEIASRLWNVSAELVGL